jgi:hypothetical protein
MMVWIVVSCIMSGSCGGVNCGELHGGVDCGELHSVWF